MRRADTIGSESTLQGACAPRSKSSHSGVKIKTSMPSMGHATTAVAWVTLLGNVPPHQKLREIRVGKPRGAKGAKANGEKVARVAKVIQLAVKLSHLLNGVVHVRRAATCQMLAGPPTPISRKGRKYRRWKAEKMWSATISILVRWSWVGHTSRSRVSVPGDLCRPDFHLASLYRRAYARMKKRIMPKSDS